MTSIQKLSLAALSALTLTSFGPVAVASAEPALSLSVVSPAGTTQRLEFRNGEGWRSVAEARVVRTALPNTPAAATSVAAQPLAVFLDQPTGGTFVYLAEEGWKYLGRSDASHVAPSVPEAADRPITLFVDGPSGFVYTYAAEKGWKFAGRVADKKF